MERRLSIALVLIALPACAANRAPSDAGPAPVDASLDGGGGADAGLGASSRRRLVVHDVLSPALPAPPTGRYLALELSLVNERGAPEAMLFEGAFEIEAPGGVPSRSLAPPDGWSPEVIPCPASGTVPADGFFRCTALFAVPVATTPDRVRFVGAPTAAALFSDVGPIDARRLCEAAAESPSGCRVCAVEVVDGACATQVATALRICEHGTTCERLDRADDACASAVSAQHLCIEAVCPACGYVSGVQ